MLFFKWFLLSYSILGLFWFCLVVLHQSWQRPFSRRAVNPEPISFLDSDSDYVPTLPGSEVFGTRYYRHARHPSPEGLAEVCPWSIYSSVNIVLVGVDFCLFFTYHTLSWALLFELRQLAQVNFDSLGYLYNLLLVLFWQLDCTALIISVLLEGIYWQKKKKKKKYFSGVIVNHLFVSRISPEDAEHKFEVVLFHSCQHLPSHGKLFTCDLFWNILFAETVKEQLSSWLLL